MHGTIHPAATASVALPWSVTWLAVQWWRHVNSSLARVSDEECERLGHEFDAIENSLIEIPAVTRAEVMSKLEMVAEMEGNTAGQYGPFLEFKNKCGVKLDCATYSSLLASAMRDLAAIMAAEQTTPTVSQ